MKRIFGILLLFSATGLFSLDFGLSVGNASVVSRAADSAFIQANKATLWAEIPIGAMTLNAQGVYDFVYNWTPTTTVIEPLRVDLGQLKLAGLNPLNGGVDGVLEWTVGRFSPSDLSGWLLGGPMDGLDVEWQKGNLRLAGEAYYTGLVLKKNSRVGISAADIIDQKTDSVLLAPPRVIGSFSASLFEIFARQDLSFELLSEVDLRKEDPGKTDTLHSTYFTTLLSGPLPSGFRYQAFFTTAMLNRPDASEFALMIGSQVSWTLPFMGSRLVWDAQYATRLTSQSDALFLPVGGRTLSTIAGLGLGNGASTGVDFSIRPISKTTFGAKVQSLFRTTDQATGIVGFDSTSSSRVVGFESLGYISWNVSSEFSLGVTGGAFIPFSGAFVAGTNPTYLAVLTADLEI